MKEEWQKGKKAKRLMGYKTGKELRSEKNVEKGRKAKERKQEIQKE